MKTPPGEVSERPERVEDVFASHPNVVQAVVFRIPDEPYGERVAAMVVTRDRAEPDVAGYSRGRLADFEVPERITFADELPPRRGRSIDPKSPDNSRADSDMIRQTY